MLFEGFDSLLPPEHREVNKGVAAFLPTHITAEIDKLNAWVYDTVNNGVYKVGFATSLPCYKEHVGRLFQSLDRLEDHLSQPKHYPYLFGQYITEADIRLFTTLIRFDVAYYTYFKCNLKMIRRDYPRLHAWLRRLYWSEGPETCGGVFKDSTRFDVVSRPLLFSTKQSLTTIDYERLQCRRRQDRCADQSRAANNAFVKNVHFDRLSCLLSHTQVRCGFIQVDGDLLSRFSNTHVQRFPAHMSTYFFPFFFSGLAIVTGQPSPMISLIQIRV